MAFADLDAAYDAFNANLDYDRGGVDLDKAQTVVEAARFVLFNRPSQTARSGESHQLDPEYVQKMLEKAEKAIEANDPSRGNAPGGVRYVRFNGVNTARGVRG